MKSGSVGSSLLIKRSAGGSTSGTFKRPRPVANSNSLSPFFSSTGKSPRMPFEYGSPTRGSPLTYER